MGLSILDRRAAEVLEKEGRALVKNSYYLTLTSLASLSILSDTQHQQPLELITVASSLANRLADSCKKKLRCYST